MIIKKKPFYLRESTREFILAKLSIVNEIELGPFGKVNFSYFQNQKFKGILSNIIDETDKQYVTIIHTDGKKCLQSLIDIHQYYVLVWELGNYTPNSYDKFKFLSDTLELYLAINKEDFKLIDKYDDTELYNQILDNAIDSAKVYMYNGDKVNVYDDWLNYSPNESLVTTETIVIDYGNKKY